MNMKQLLTVSGIALAAPAWANDNALTHIHYSSTAYHADSGEIAYAENHTYTETAQGPQNATVKYLSPEGNIVAEKRLDFSTSPESPFFSRKNFKTGYQEGFASLAGNNRNQGRLFQISADNAATCNETFGLRPGMIVDAGFNIHLQNNLAALGAGNKLTFDLLIPKACRAIEFEASAEREEKGLMVSLRPTGFLARLVVPETRILYDEVTGNLLAYHGLSDLTNAQGRSMKVDIYFNPPQRQEQVATNGTGTNANQSSINERQ